MATFRAIKAYRFSPDGTDEKTWAKFDKVPNSDPPAFEAEVTKASDVAALRKLIKDKVPGYTDITEVEPVKAASKTAAEKAAEKAAAEADAAAKAEAEKAVAEAEAAAKAEADAKGTGDGDQNGA